MAAADSKVREAIAGDPAAFGDLVVQYAPLVYSVLLATVRRREPLEDLAQETFIKAFRARDSLRDPGHLGAWLAQIAHRTALDWRAAQRTRARTEEALAGDDWLADADAPDDVAHHRQLAEALWRAMDGLDEGSRRLLLLRHVEGCSYREVARFLGMPTASAYQRVRRAERALAADLLSLLRGRRAGRARRLALRSSVLVALGLERPAAAAASLTPMATAHTAWKVAAACLGVSAAVHVAGLLVPWTFPGGGDAGGPQAPAGTPDPSGIHLRLDPMAPEAAPQAQAPGETSRARPLPVDWTAEDLSPQEAPAPVSWAQLEPAARAQRAAPRPADPADGEGAAAADSAGPALRVAFRAVQLRGAVSPRGPFLDDLTRYLPACCGIAAQVLGGEGDIGFYDPQLLEIPIHFFLQGGALGPRPGTFLQLSDREEERFREYLARGGFLYFEGDPPFLHAVVALLRRVAPESARLISVPQDHPIYTVLFDLAGGFPGQHPPSPSDNLWAARWQLPPTDLQAVGWRALWGVERDGALLAVLTQHPMFRGWPADVFASRSDSAAPAPPIKEPYLRVAANLVVYAMEQRGLVP